jgi:hypothetical protein
LNVIPCQFLSYFTLLTGRRSKCLSSHQDK